MIILNLGCGTRASSDVRVVNIDWSPYLVIRENRLLRTVVPPLLDAERRQRFAELPASVMAHDLRRGIPFADASVDAVYHSHFLEHIGRGAATSLLSEVLRVLRPGGVHRIVVPDFLQLCVEYLRSAERAAAGDIDAATHELAVTAILEQSVRREPSGTSGKQPTRRFLENLVLGDARKRGETHEWMYDRFTLCGLLNEVGFRAPRVVCFNESAIPDWPATGLDADDGRPYKSCSLYVEAYR